MLEVKATLSKSERATKKKRVILYMKSWLVNGDPYSMAYDKKKNLTGNSNPIQHVGNFTAKNSHPFLRLKPVDFGKNLGTLLLTGSR